MGGEGSGRQGKGKEIGERNINTEII